MTAIARDSEYLPDSVAVLRQVTNEAYKATNLDRDMNIGGYVSRMLQGPAANIDEPLYDNGISSRNAIMKDITDTVSKGRADNLFLGANLDRVKHVEYGGNLLRY